MQSIDALVSDDFLVENRKSFFLFDIILSFSMVVKKDTKTRLEEMSEMILILVEKRASHR